MATEALNIMFSRMSTVWAIDSLCREEARREWKREASGSFTCGV